MNVRLTASDRLPAASTVRSANVYRPGPRLKETGDVQRAKAVSPSIRHSKVVLASTRVNTKVAAPDCVGITGSGGTESTRTVRETVRTLPAGSIAAISNPCTPSTKSYGCHPDSQLIVERAPPGKRCVHSNRACGSRGRELEDRVGLPDHASRAGGDRQRGRERVDDERPRRLAQRGAAVREGAHAERVLPLREAGV